MLKLKEKEICKLHDPDRFMRLVILSTKEQDKLSEVNTNTDNICIELELINHYSVLPLIVNAFNQGKNEIHLTYIDKMFNVDDLEIEMHPHITLQIAFDHLRLDYWEIEEKRRHFMVVVNVSKNTNADA